MNTIVLVGKLAELPKIKTTPTGLKVAQLILDCEKNFRNQKGEIEIERYALTIWRAVSETVIEECQIGDLLSVKGRLQADNYTNDKGELIYKIQLVAENVTILNFR